MLNYDVDASLLEAYVPAGTELDQFKGKTYLSLIGFEFNNTRIGGVPVPFHGSFEEVNLRFYVRRDAKRGVVFIRELVPKLAVVAIARLAFGENYACAPMSHRMRRGEGRDSIAVEYIWGSGIGRCSLKGEAQDAAAIPPDGSLGQFITEHYWGYAAQKDGGSIEYEVQHPQWHVREAKAAEFAGDATRYYPAELARAVMRPPDSAFVADGSAVTVFKGKRIA
jgi:uncharacterized protein YqjF (DUF2071 family)